MRRPGGGGSERLTCKSDPRLIPRIRDVSFSFKEIYVYYIIKNQGISGDIEHEKYFF